MKDLQDCYILKNGVKMPCVGYGTYKTHEEETYRAVRAAIDIGYRHIDTASLYGNEAAVGRFLRREIGFLDIPRLVAAALDRVRVQDAPSLEDLLAADAAARRAVETEILKGVR